MLEKLSDTRVFLEENVAYILMAAGVALGLAGIFTVSLMERPTFSLVTIYFGVSLTVTGLLRRIGFITFGTNLQGNVGSLLLLASCFSLAGAVISLMDMEILRMWVPGMGARNPLHHNVHIEQEYPLLWLFTPLLSVTLVCGALGAVLKLRSE